MKKLAVLIAVLLLFPTIALATVTQYSAGGYAPPSGSQVMA